MGHIYHDHIYRKKERKDFRISIGGGGEGEVERISKEGRNKVGEERRGIYNKARKWDGGGRGGRLHLS